uniref:Ig-like domain-containing protein n=1 Tax=Chelonoidis abingdonii TaxID=106734 RepID=A0A8C0JF54_CHEAB
CLFCLWLRTALISPVTAHFGGDVTLNCLFLSKPGMNIQHLTITWQKERAGAEALVVHSHYYGKDQLERQDEAYRNRTQLDPEGLAQGNASLTLSGVRTQDEGIYHCHVTSELGTTSETKQVTVMAPYSEPHLTIDPSFWPDHTLLTFSLGGGYPQASVAWRDGMGTNLTELSSTTESVDAWGLYTLRSELAVPMGQTTNLTVPFHDFQDLPHGLQSCGISWGGWQELMGFGDSQEVIAHSVQLLVSLIYFRWKKEQFSSEETRLSKMCIFILILFKNVYF